MRIFSFSFTVIMIISYASVCQSRQDSLYIIQSKAKILASYDESMGGNHHLYNGSEYVAYVPIDDEHPYFETDEWTLSSLKYDSQWFYHVPLLFDINKNELVTSYYYNETEMKLINTKVDEFILNSHHFINAKNISNNGVIRSGFYELLYNGTLQVLAKRTKSLVSTIDGKQEIRSFKESNSLFILFEGEAFKINGKRDIINVMKVKKVEIRSFIRKNHLFKMEKENSIVQTTKYFDSIIQK